MKFVKGVAIFSVLCLALYGAYALLKRPPQLDIPESDLSALSDIGIHVRDPRAADSGLSGILSDVEGVAPVTAAIGSPIAGSGSSTPPSFLTGSTASSTPPAFIDATPRVAVAPPAPSEPQAVIDVLPPPTFSEPVDLLIQEIPETPQVEAPAFDTPPLEVLSHPSVSPLASVAESPPPWLGNWDGPTSDISATPPPAEILQILPPTQPSPSPETNTLTNTLVGSLPPVHNIVPEHITLPPTGEVVRKTEENVRKIESVSVPKETTDQHPTFSSLESISIEVATMANTRYTTTAPRQPLAFEPVKPEISPTAPMVAFAPPKRSNQPAQPAQPLQSEQFQEPVAVASATVHSGAAHPAAVIPEVRQIGTPRLIENAHTTVASPEQPTIRETIERFVQTQRQLAETGDPENIRQAFIQLSQLYELEQLEDAERALLQPVLDVLALRVIYARETHILEPFYRVKPGETVESIARDCNLTPALLRKINGLGSSQELPAGATLKIVFGQFDARISMKQRELTLLLGGLYAGRFPFSLPNENVSVRKGEFYVTHRTDQMAVLNNGWVLATERTQNATIVFADRDAREIFDILSEQSVVVLD